MAYATSGFMIGWSGWPQSNVAALMPGLFWAIHVLVERPRPRVAAALGLVVGLMIWANFPTITAYALVVGGLVGLGGALTMFSPGERVAALVPRLIMVFGGWCSVPDSVRTTCCISVRISAGPTPGPGNVSRLTPRSVRSSFLRSCCPKPMERATTDERFGFVPELARGAVLCWPVCRGSGASVVRLLRAGRGRERSAFHRRDLVGGRRRHGHGSRMSGGPPTELVNSLPFLSFSSVGRIRVDHLSRLRRARRHWAAGVARQSTRDRRGRSPKWAATGRPRSRDGLGGDGTIHLVLVLDDVTLAFRELLRAAVGPLFFAALVILILLAWHASDRPGAGIAVIGLTAVVAVDLLAASASVPTVVDRSAATLTLEAHRAAIESLEPGERMAGEGRVFFANTGQVTGLDDARGQLVVPPGWRDLYRAIDSDHFRDGGTVYNPWFRDVDVFNPALDRMGVGVWAADPRTPIVGRRSERTPGEDSVLLDDEPMPGGGPPRRARRRVAGHRGGDHRRGRRVSAVFATFVHPVLSSRKHFRAHHSAAGPQGPRDQAS